MNKKATAGILAGFLACSLAGGGCMLVTANASVVGKTDTDFVSNQPDVVCTYAEDGFTNITGDFVWAHSGATKNKYKLDGLTIEMDFTSANDLPGNEVWGFALGTGTGSFFGTNSTVTVAHWQGLFTQNRLWVGSNHDTAGTSLAYSDAALTNNSFGLDSSMVMNNVTHSHYTFKFESESETAWKLTISMPLSIGALWEANANYSKDETYSSVVTYLSKEAVAGSLDANGYTHVVFGGFRSSSDGKYSMNVKVSDDATREYQEADVVAAKEKVEAYTQAEITDEGSFTAAMEAREEALEAVNALKAREKAELTEEIETADAAYKTYETVQTLVKELVQAKIDEANEAFEAIFSDESTLSQESIAAAKGKVVAAETEYDDKKAFLSEESDEELGGGITAINYSSKRIAVLEWIVNYETAIDELNTAAETIGEDIAAAKATKVAFEGDYRKSLLNNELTEEHKTAYNARITAADAALAAKEEEAAVAVKTAYVVAFEDTLDNLGSYSRIKAAFAQKAIVEESITLTAEDGELYTRFNDGVDTLYTALEKFISDAISYVSTELDGTFDKLEEFSPVHNSFNEISLELLSEDREATATIEAAYEATAEKLRSNVWYNFSQTGLTKVEQNEKGIYFEKTSFHWPDHINYNKPLDLSKGTEIVIEFTEIGYYNGDKTESGGSKGAHNLCINFLNAPNSYKGGSAGLTVIIWLFEVESSVQIVNAKDASIAVGTLSTPINGGKLTLSLKHGEYEDFASEEKYDAYILTVNGVEIVLSDTLAEANGISVNDECYFSFGVFSDYKGDTDRFTLISVDGETFEKKAGEEPNPGPNPGPNPDDKKPGDKPKDNTGLIVGLSVAGGVVVLAGAGVGVWFFLKKKKSSK